MNDKFASAQLRKNIVTGLFGEDGPFKEAGDALFEKMTATMKSLEMKQITLEFNLREYDGENLSADYRVSGIELADVYTENPKDFFEKLTEKRKAK